MHVGGDGVSACVLEPVGLPAAQQERPSTEIMQAVAVEVGACVHPIMQRLIDTTTGEARVVAIPCGATWAGHCPPCAERNRKVRATQCREGWHLDQDPIPPKDDQQRDDQDDEHDQAEDDPARRVRPTRRLDDVPDLPRLPVEARSLGREFTGRDGADLPALDVRHDHDAVLRPGAHGWNAARPGLL